MACTVRQSPCAWQPSCRRCPASGLGSCGVAGPMWAAALGGCEWLESWKLGRTLDDAVLDLVRRLADAPLPDPPPVLRALLGHTLDEVLLRGLTALYSLLGCEEQQRPPDGSSDGAAVSATWLDAQYQELAEDEKRLGSDHPSVRERQATLDELSRALRQSQKKSGGPGHSTADISSWEQSRASSLGDTTDTGASSMYEDPRLTKGSPNNASLLPEWILPGVAESQEDIRSGDRTTEAEEDGAGKPGKKVRFSPDEGGKTGPPCECCGAPRAPPVAPPPSPRAPCACTCGQATRVCPVRQTECVCKEPSSGYVTGRGTSAMPSRVDAADGTRKPSETPAGEAGTGDPAAAKKLSSVRSLAGKGGEAAPAETDWHSAESTPAARASALWRRSTPCPCCPQRRRRPRGPTCCPEQILWAVTKICIFPDASRTYEVLTPTFEKPPRATGRTHVVFAMRAPATDKPATA